MLKKRKGDVKINNNAYHITLHIKPSNNVFYRDWGSHRRGTYVTQGKADENSRLQTMRQMALGE